MISSSQETANSNWTAYSGVDTISEVAKEWSASARNARASIPYCSAGYGLALLRAYHVDDEPILFQSEVNGSQAYLATVARPLHRMGRRINERGFPFNPNTILNDPLLGDKTQGVVQARALLEGVFAAGAETLILDHLAADGIALNCLIEAAKQIGCGSDEPRAARTLYHADLSGNWDDYLATRSRNHRWQIRKALKSMQADDDVSIIQISGRGGIRAALPDWFDVETRSWQGSDPVSAMNDTDRAFHSCLLDTLPDDEVGDLWMVRLDGRPVAALRMLAGPGQVSVHTMHFDVAEKHRAPGLLAFIAMMQSACNAGLSEVDMHGSTEFFARWATGTREHQSIRFYCPGMRGQALRAARKLAFNLSNRRMPEA